MKILISFIYAILLTFAVFMTDRIFIRKRHSDNRILIHFCGFIIASEAMIWLFTVTENSLGAFYGVSTFYIFFTNALIFFYWFTLRYCDRDIRFRKSKIAHLGIFTDIIIFANLFTKFFFTVYKKQWGGYSYWYVTSSIEKFQIYKLIYLFWIIIICASIAQLVIKSFNVPQLYRGRYIYLAIFAFVHSVFQMFGIIYGFPSWFENVFLIPFSSVVVYLAVYYSSIVFKQVALLNVAQTLSDGLIIYDESGKMIYINDKLQNLVGVSEYNAFSTRESFEIWSQKLVDINGIRVKKITNNGHDYYFNIVSHEFSNRKTYMGISYTLQDITETMEHLEIVENANEELIRAGHMKSDFLANMSHEIRTPMNAVIGMAEMALREEMTDDARDYINQIKSSGKTLVNIINDILDFSKIESGKMEIIPAEYGLLSELHDVASTLMTRIGDKDIELTFEENPNIPSKMEGDILRIRQILINLANNAIKFTNHGRVQIIIDFEKIDADNINLIFHIVDTGIGIKEEDLAKLFNSFQQVDTKRNRNIEGTGLGLAISKSLVQAMGGTIAVDSTYGKGSDFHFSIPQKVVDPSPIIMVESAGDKFAFGYLSKKYLARRFFIDANKMGVFTHALIYPSNFEKEYELYRHDLEGKKHFFFFEENDYNDEIKGILQAHPDIHGIILTNFASNFRADLNNIRVIKKPLTTYNISLALNELEIHNEPGEKNVFDANFTAPDANILIVDDNPINLTIAKGLLDPLQMHIDTVQSGKEAFELLKKQSYDIVFMDHMMPQMDGVETTKLIRRSLPLLSGMPIIALTANAVSGVKDFFLSVGMNDFVPKPIDVSDITAKVRIWLPENKIVKNGQIHKYKYSDFESHDEAEANAENAADDKLELEGIDVKTAVKMLGSKKVYMTVLTEYYKTIDNNIENINALYSSENWNDYAIKVHALKSSSRQIGAMELGEKAYALELAGKEGKADFIKENHDDMIGEYLKVKETLSPLFPEDEDDAGDRSPISKDQLTSLLNDLKDACDDLDMDKMETITSEIGSYSLSEEGDDLYKKLKDAADSIDTETCMELANQWLELL